MAARNIYRTEINIYEKLCVKLVIYTDHTRMHGQQNMQIQKCFQSRMVTKQCSSFTVCTCACMLGAS